MFVLTETCCWLEREEKYCFAGETLKAAAPLVGNCGVEAERCCFDCKYDCGGNALALAA